jgi:hypothetical protein
LVIQEAFLPPGVGFGVPGRFDTARAPAYNQGCCSPRGAR